MAARMPEYTDASLKCSDLQWVYQNEMDLLHVVDAMYERGIQVDTEYVRKALAWENLLIEKSKDAFYIETGFRYQDSAKLFKQIFDLRGEKYGKTAKGNASFTSEVLEELDTPTAKLINQIRHHEKRAGTYWSSFLYYADEEGILRANAGPANTTTGRFSYRNPNLQNLQAEDSDEYPIRRAFIPRPEHALVSIDYNQVEYRLMLDYANEKLLIDMVNAGFDVHEATAQMMGVDRHTAKTINFALLYGAGVEKLARMLGVPVTEAKRLRDLYFARLPKVKQFINAVTRTGEQRGYVYNWLGRRFYMNNYDYSYKLPNHLIQGSAADVCKMAMVKTFGMAPLLIQIHDELLFEIHKDNFSVIDELAEIMESIYKPKNGMGLTVSVAHSFVSWSKKDLIDGKPT